MRYAALLPLCCLCACGGEAGTSREGAVPQVATFSIAAFDPATGDLGVAVQSRFLAVGAVVPYVRADVGALATQALAEPSYGPDGLYLLDEGQSPEQVVRALTAADPGREKRQVGVVAAGGACASFTGKQTPAWSGHVVGEGYCCQGNILAGERVVKEMARAFEETRGPLAERLLAALTAGQRAGGDKRGRQSAALLVARRAGGYRGRNDRYIDLRVDDHETPIRELGRLLALRRRIMPDGPLPEQVAGLVREPHDATPETARAAWRRLRAAGEATSSYVGTKLEGERAIVYFARRGEAALEHVALQRRGAAWVLAK